MTLDTRSFEKTFNEYLKFSKRLPADAVNSALYFIARNATQTTKHSSKAKIRGELEGPARIGSSLGGVLVNAALGKKGLPGLNGSKMRVAINKLIRQRAAHINFIRSGWKNAVDTLERYLKATGQFGFARRNSFGNSQADRATMRKKVSRSSGKATVANINRGTRAWGEIQNDIGGDGKPTLSEIKLRGLQEAINKEEKSKIQYIERKLNQEHAKFNR